MKKRVMVVGTRDDIANVLAIALPSYTMIHAHTNEEILSFLRDREAGPIALVVWVNSYLTDGPTMDGIQAVRAWGYTGPMLVCADGKTGEGASVRELQLEAGGPNTLSLDKHLLVRVTRALLE